MKKKTSLVRKLKEDGFNISAVYWKDATGHDEMPEGGLKPIRVVTLGVVLEVTKEHVLMVSECFEDESSRQITSIPRGMVKKIVTLKGVAPSLVKVFGKR